MLTLASDLHCFEHTGGRKEEGSGEKAAPMGSVDKLKMG